MGDQLTPQEKQMPVARYQKGESVSSICMQSGTSKSTFCNWVKQYSTLTSRMGNEVTPREIELMKRRLEKANNLVSVLKAVHCTAFSSLQEKLAELERLHGEFSVHVLCEALDVPRGTFYNHISRAKRGNALHVKRREGLRIRIQEIFDDSKQRCGGIILCVAKKRRTLSD